ncbi:MAG TPA: hypothetical protein VM262_16505, partial [Acidimicrobiales bacterium]|nr:hypothetical protein [Acidimicrobiales bacterium]
GGSGSTSGAGTSPGAAGATPGTSGGVGPGVTEETIALGIPYCNDCASANAALGAGSEDPGDTRRYYQAALDDVNARGGVIGRELVPVFQEVSAADDIARSQQAACEAFTADNKVLMMFFRGEIIYECALRAGVLAWGTGGTGPTYAKFPNLFAPSSIRLERLFQVTVRSMVAARWHEPTPRWPTGKIGLITWDDAEYRYAMEHGYLAGLREAGLKEQDVRYVTVPASAGGVAESSAAISNAVLSFSSQGIDHVFIGDGPAGIFSGTGLTLLFLTNAQSQGYFPRYGFNSNNSPDFESHPREQLVGMMAIDSFDTTPENDEGIELNPVRERCFEVMREAGLPVGQWLTQAIAIGACEIAWFAEVVIGRASDTTLDNMIAAGESLGTSYRSPYNYGNRLGPGQHDGVALFRSLEWDEGCSCVKYTSTPFEP